MSNYEIKVDIKVTEISEAGPVMNKPIKIKDGSFKINISEKAATSIDKCEQAFLETNYAAIRDAISDYLTQLSKKNSRANKRRRISKE